MSNILPIVYRAVAYARYSTTKQTELSIAMQLKAIDDFCNRGGIQLVAPPYVDEARTGTNMDRDGMQRLLRDAEQGAFNAVVIYDISRGSRDVIDWFSFRKHMAALGVKVFSVTNNLGELDDPDAFISEFITAGLGQHHVLQSRQKSIAAKRIRAERGQFCGGYAPLGYDIVKTGGCYVINHLEAEAVRTAFSMYAGGSTYDDIITVIHRMGVTGKRGQQLCRNTLHFILKNPRYRGTFIWFDEQVRHMKKWVGKKADNPVVIDGVIPRIVEDDVWYAVQRRMADNKANRMNHAKPGRQYMLTGMLRCACCGGPMVGTTTVSKGIEYKRYFCLNRQRLRNCTMPSIRGDKLESYLINLLKDRLLSPALIDKMAETLFSALSATSTVNASAIQDDIRALQQKNSNLLNAIENGLPMGDAISRINQNNSKIESLTAALREIPAAPAVSLAQIREELSRDTELLSLSEDVGTLLRRYIKSVEIGLENINVSIYPEILEKTKGPQSISGVASTVGSPGAECSVLNFTFPRSLVA